MDIKQLDDSAIEVLTVPELKEYLRLYGQYVTGRKADLTERLKGIKILSMKNVNKVNSSDDKLEVSDDTSDWNKQKLISPLGEVLPDLKIFVSFRISQIMKAKQQLRSGIFYHDRHIHSIEYHDVSESCSHCIVRCLVIPSIPTSNQKKNPDHRVKSLSMRTCHTGEFQSGVVNTLKESPIVT
uniref:SAP domain-containing protein n=1 Tax=Octopus bimaculoides TaxID=37653 RepID=A0A0L8HEE8_OCTBM